jgi:methyltransferase-like protein/predicted O-methyltransferase YrrM
VGHGSSNPEDHAPAERAAPASSPASSYDAVPYSVGAFPQTRPDRLATIATLFGMTPARPSRCRVLELGCAAGGNIIPMATADPHSQFVGIDLSPRQIAEAQATARELGVRNLDLRALDILDLPADLGTFDYILCHGVYSWVPPQVQDKILDICSNNLSPQGVAYISYNCYPGWHARGAIREMIWYHTEQFADPAVRVRAARGLLAFLAKAAQDDSGYGVMIRQELAILLATPDTYLLHEHLEEFNEPLYFHQFVGRAADKGLQYLGEAYIGAMVAGKFGPQTEEILRKISPDLLHMEQYMDFLRNRMFRQTLLCHAGLKLDYAVRGETVTNFYVATTARPAPLPAGAAPDAAQEFRTEGKPTLTTSDPLMKSAMTCLAEAAPLPLRFDDLLAAARARLADSAPADSPETSRQLATRLLNCHLSGLVEFSISPPAFTTKLADRPLASPYARLRARDGGKIVNVRLESINLSAPSRLILQHLDGHHDRAALIDLVVQWLKTEAPAEPDALSAPPGGDSGHSSPAPDQPREARAASYVDALLRGFAQSALLIPS